MRRSAARYRPWLLAFAASLAIAVGTTVAPAQEPVKIKIGNLGFPSHSAMIINVLKEKAFDKKHGIELEPKVYGAVSAYYGSAASGETDGVPGGPLVLQKMRLEGVPLKIVSTMVDMTSMSVITKDPAIKSITDLKGKTIAADMASSEYSVLSLYAKSKGIVFGKDATVVQAGPPLVRTQLAADRVDAGMTWEPTATMTMADNPKYHIVFNGKQGWRELTGKDGWLLALGLREDWIAKNAVALPRVIAAFDEAARYMRSNPDDCDKILQAAIKLPPGAFKDMITAPRVVFQVRSTADPSARETLWEVIKVAMAEGYFKEPVRDQSVIHVP
jgi:ABC-type nitrate/sulfonate/bicarbonate transport system substrate-binding protein